MNNKVWIAMLSFCLGVNLVLIIVNSLRSAPTFVILINVFATIVCSIAVTLRIVKDE